MNNKKLLKEAIKYGFKIGYVDIENSPKVSWNYGDYNVNIPYNQIEVPSQITSIAYMDENTKQVVVEEWKRPKSLHDIYVNHTKDYKLLKKVIPELNKFDLLIGQNLDDFDIRTMNGRAWILKLKPVTTILSIDTLKQSRKVFRLASHKLDAMTTQANLGAKIKQDMQDCIQTAKGNVKVSNRRLKYNKRDVSLGSKLLWSQVDYYKLPKQLVTLLRLYIQCSKEKDINKKSFCIVCASLKQARFNVRKHKNKKGYKFTCDNCEHEWKVEL